jgi:acetyl-CoA acetyltransferase
LSGLSPPCPFLTVLQIHPVDLGAVVLKELVARTKIDPAQIDDVIFGCVSQVGGQAGNLGRNCVLAAGYPESVPVRRVGGRKRYSGLTHARERRATVSAAPRCRRFTSRPRR